MTRSGPLGALPFSVLLACGTMMAAAPAVRAARTPSPALSYAVAELPDPLLDGLQPTADAATRGMWSPVQSWPLLTVHLAVLPDGRVLSFGSPNGYGDIQDGRTFDFWSPLLGFASAAHLTMPNAQAVDSFCSGAAILPASGQLLVTGGASAVSGNTAFGSTVVTPATATVANSNFALAAQRWYGTMITMADGRPLIVGGSVPYADVHAYQNVAGLQDQMSVTPEVFTPGKGWSSLLGATSTGAFGAQSNRNWYPRMWTAANGTVFGISTETVWQLDPKADTIKIIGTFKTAVDNTTKPNVGPTSTAVMFDANKILQVGGNGYNNEDFTPSSNAATVFDITNPSAPRIADTNPMRYARQWANSLVLPNGKVLVTGGSDYGNSNGADAIYPAEIWTPSTGQWTTGASAAIYRGYHSSTVLLPDGTVLSAGGGAPGPVANLNAEIYYPPYLFTASGATSVLAVRPRIVGLSDVTVGNGASLQVQMADGSRVSGVSLIGLSATTHAFNAAGRRVRVSFTQSGATLRVAIPASADILPPGYYQITVLNAAGTPSRGVILGVNAAAPRQTEVTAVLPADGAPRSLSLAAQPGTVIRHANFLGWASAISPASVTLDRMDSSFMTHAGLANPQCSSFESVNYPGYFLRRNNTRLVLNQNDASAGFASDATFCAAAGLSGTGFSLEAYGDPSLFVHVRPGTDVGLDPSDNSDAFAQASSFVFAQEILPTDQNTHSLASLGAAGALVRHQNYQGFVFPISSASSAADMADASFLIRAGNADATCYSFEAGNFPGYFLRHRNFVLYLDQNDGSDLFQQDSTFCLSQGLAGSGLSLHAVNYPDHYLSQQTQDGYGTLMLTTNDNSAGFAANATFSLVPSP